MLSNAKVQPTLPVVDLARARRFYEETLGLKFLEEDPSPGIMFEAGAGSRLYIYQRAATKADHTAAAFQVDNVEAEVKVLKAKGVKFEDIDMPGIKTVNGVAEFGSIKSAWFKDTEGNILGIANM